MTVSLVTKIVFGLSIVGFSIQNLQAADDSSKNMEITAHKKIFMKFQKRKRPQKNALRFVF